MAASAERRRKTEPLACDSAASLWQTAISLTENPIEEMQQQNNVKQTNRKDTIIGITLLIKESLSLLGYSSLRSSVK